jgi:hypothetical protein
MSQVGKNITFFPTPDLELVQGVTYLQMDILGTAVGCNLGSKFLGLIGIQSVP